MRLPGFRGRSQVSPRNADGSRGIAGLHLGRVRITPTRTTLAIALIGSLLFVAYAVTVRDASQIPLLATGAGILGIVFVALALAAAVSTYREASAGRAGRAMLMALGGGVAALLAAGVFSGAVILALLWRS
jgi:hypothetical protein